ncbi:MAG: hypothetical protein WAZ94_13455 [Phycisphaerales bacterium]
MSVRLDIISAVMTALEGVSGVQAVIAQGEDRPSLTADDPSKFVLTVFADGDRRVSEDRSATEVFEFSVTVIAYLPVPGTGETHAGVADALCALVYALYGGSQADGSWGGKARQTTCDVYCGGVLFDADGGRCTFHEFTVQYAFTRGNPGEAR